MTARSSRPDHEAQARKRFNSFSKSGTFERLKPWLEFQQRGVLERLDWSRVGSLLDVGCGSGWATVEAARNIDTADRGLVCGCDISVGMLARGTCEADAGALVGWSAASAQALPYRNDSFDAVMCTAAFHHFPAPHEALGELLRVLRPGGFLRIAETCTDQSFGTWLWDRWHRWFEPGHVRYYRRGELAEMISSTGFAKVEVIELYGSFGATRKLFRRAALFEAVAP